MNSRRYGEPKHRNTRSAAVDRTCAPSSSRSTTVFRSFGIPCLASSAPALSLCSGRKRNRSAASWSITKCTKRLHSKQTPSKRMIAVPGAALLVGGLRKTTSTMISDRQHTKIASHIWAQSRTSALQVDRLRFPVMRLLSRALPPNQSKFVFLSIFQPCSASAWL